MSLALVVIANGRRDELVETMTAIARHVSPAPDVTLICDDSGAPDAGSWLAGMFPHATIDAHPHLGHGPAVQRAWEAASRLPVDWVLWMEEDMVFQRDVDLTDVAGVIGDQGLSQMVFKRQSHFPAEVAAGPTMIDRFEPVMFSDRETDGHRWLLHRQFYSLNPHLVTPGFLRDHPWPPIPNSEHHFGRQLFRDLRVRVGLWGARGDAPIVLHVGTERTGSGY